MNIESYLVDESEHHLTHVNEVLSSQVIVHHDDPLHLLINLVSEVLRLFSQRVHFLSGLCMEVNKVNRRYLWEDEFIGFYWVGLHSFCLLLLATLYSPEVHVLLLEELLLGLHELGISGFEDAFGLFSQMLSFSESCCFLSVVLEPTVKLSVKNFSRLQDEIAIPQNQSSESLIE